MLAENRKHPFKILQNPAANAQKVAKPAKNQGFVKSTSFRQKKLAFHKFQIDRSGMGVPRMGVMAHAECHSRSRQNADYSNNLSQNR